MKKIRIFAAFLLMFVFHAACAAESATGIAYTTVQVQIARIQIQEGVSFDDAVASLKLRANQYNLKFVGDNKLHKEIEALTGKPAKRMEIFNFCDGLAADKMIAADPMMIAYMPCRIALLEDKDGKRWVISMMIDELIRSLPADARNSAERIMAAMKDMMVAASKGDL